MRKAIVFLVAAALALAACIVNSFDDASATVAAPEGTGITDGLGGEINFPADSELGTVRFVIPAEGSASGAARSVSGAGLSDVKSVGRGVRNIYQLIAVDESSPNAVWGFDEIRSSGTLSVGILKGHTYHFLFLGGHLEDAAASVGPGNQPTLLASGYLSKTMSAEAGSSRFSLLMTPLVVDAAFVRNGAGGGEARQVGRLARTVGLDANASYTFRVVLGDDESGALAPDDALRAAKSTKRYGGITPLVEAQAGESDWGGELRLVSNAAWFGAAELEDWNDANKADAAGKPHTTHGTAEYMLPTLAAGTATTASFKMEYAPFGLGGGAWTAGVNGGVKPVWVIRNGLNDDPQDADTDFANYGKKDDQDVLIKPAANANGAISVAVVNPAAALGAGLYEDGNPWPIANTGMTGGAGDLSAALTYLNTNGTAAKYGAYTIRLGVDPSLPVYPGAKITLGDGGGGDWQYPAITSTTLIIEGTAPVVMPGPELLWALSNGDSVRYGHGIVPPITITPSAGILDSAFSVRTTGYAVAVPSNVNEVTFTALVLDASAAVSYDVGTGYTETPPVATLSGLTGSVTFSVKVTSPTVEHVWGPYTFDVSRAFAVSDGLTYTESEDDDYIVLIFTGGTGTVDLSAPVVDILLIGGGGGGGGGVWNVHGGGGGAGGLVYKTGFTVQAGDYTVSIGSAGAGTGGASLFYLSSAGTPANGISANGVKAPGGGAGAGTMNGAGGAGGSGGGGTGSGLGGAASGGNVIGHAGTSATEGGGGGGAGSPGSGQAGGAGLKSTDAGYEILSLLGGSATTEYAKGGRGQSLVFGANYGDGGGGAGGGFVARTGASGVVIIRWAK